MKVSSHTDPAKLAFATIRRLEEGAPHVPYRAIGVVAQTCVLWAVIQVQQDTGWELSFRVRPLDAQGDREEVSMLEFQVWRDD